MKKFLSRLIFFGLLLQLAVSLSAAEKFKVKDLPERYRLWLEEEVFYIMTSVEKDVFLELRTDHERDLFIEAFWKQRDPTPETEENEFRKEHDRRIQYANRMFRAAGKPGWKTERGKAYIVLGEPKDIRIFNGTDSYYPAELWFYQGLPFQSLPQAFHLLFFQKGRVGDFRLYDPATDGPWNLMSNYEGDPGNYQQAYEILSDMEPELANASLSLIPGENLINAPSLASSMLLRTIDGAAQKTVKDLYAKKFLEYKDIVEVEYSTNYIESGYQVFVIQDRSGIHFVHFSIEPSQINMASYEGTVFTNLELNGIVTGQGGTTIFQFEKIIPLKFTEDQFHKIRQRPFSVTETFSLIPGTYKLSVLLKNTSSKEFTSFEGEISIPSSIDRPAISPLLLAFNLARSSTSASGPRPFLVGDLLFYTQATKTFLPQDILYVFFQLSGLSAQDTEKAVLKFAFFREETEVSSQTFPLTKYPAWPNILEIFPLKDFSPGYYAIRVSLMDKEGREIISRKEDFEISPLAYLPRPWVYSKSMFDAGEPEIHHILGRQLMTKGDFAGALAWLEKAFRANPGQLDFAISLARAYLLLQRPKDSISTLLPFLAKETRTLDFLDLLGRACKAAGKYQEAIGYFEQAIASFGLNIDILNSMGDCHLELGNKKEALAAWEKSLKIKPDQEDIRKKVRSIG